MYHQKPIIHHFLFLASFALAQTSTEEAPWTFDAAALPTTTANLPCTVFSQAFPTETLCYTTQQGHTLYVPPFQSFSCPVDFAWSALLGRCIYTPCPSGQAFVYASGPLITGPNGKGVGACQTAGPEDAVIWYSAPAASGPAPLPPADATETPFDTAILAVPTDGLPSVVSTLLYPPTTTTLFYITSSDSTLFVPATPCPSTYSWEAIQGDCIYNPCPVGQWYGDSTGCQSLAPDDPGMRWSYLGYPLGVTAMAMATADASASGGAPAGAVTTTTATVQATTSSSEATSAATVAPIGVLQTASETSSSQSPTTTMSNASTSSGIASTAQPQTTTVTSRTTVVSTSVLLTPSQTIAQSSDMPKSMAPSYSSTTSPPSSVSQATTALAPSTSTTTIPPAPAPSPASGSAFQLASTIVSTTALAVSASASSSTSASQGGSDLPSSTATQSTVTITATSTASITTAPAGTGAAQSMTPTATVTVATYQGGAAGGYDSGTGMGGAAVLLGLCLGLVGVGAVLLC